MYFTDEQEKQLQKLRSQRKDLDTQIKALQDEKALSLSPFSPKEFIKKKGDRTVWEISSINYHPLYGWEAELTLSGKGHIKRYPHQLEGFVTQKSNSKKSNSKCQNKLNSDS